MDGNDGNDPIFAEDRTYAERTRFRRSAATSLSRPDYFRTMGNPILAGRDFTWKDIYEKRPVVLVSENLAREYCGAAPRPRSASGSARIPRAVWREVVGVAGDERDDGVNKPAPTIVYWPMLMKRVLGQRPLGAAAARTSPFAARAPARPVS